MKDAVRRQIQRRVSGDVHRAVAPVTAGGEALGVQSSWAGASQNERSEGEGGCLFHG